MKVEVLLFAQARQLVGTESVSVSIDQGSTVADLKRTLADEHPEIADLLSRSNIAVNQQYSSADDAILEDAEIAMIPPVSGG